MVIGVYKMNPVNKILGKDIFSKNKEENLHYPKPKYDKCNKGHTLVEIWNEKTQHYEWDCPICIENMNKEREGKRKFLNVMYGGGF